MDGQNLMHKRGTRKKYGKHPEVYAHIDWTKAATLFTGNGDKGSEDNRGNNIQGKETTKKILVALAAAGVVGLIFTFPTIVPALGVVAGAFQQTGWRGRKNIDRLARQKWVTVTNKDDGTVVVRITKNGMMRALSYELENMVLKRPKQWDKKWRVVIFDVPEKHRRLRDMFRIRLTQLGLYMLQKSVFISPYPCFDEVEFLRELYGVSVNVQYLLVEKLEDDVFLKNHFNL